MKNLKLATLDVMHVEVLNSKDSVSTSGGKSVGTFTVDRVSGTYDASGKRIPASYTTDTYHLDIDDAVAAFAAQLLAPKVATV